MKTIFTKCVNMNIFSIYQLLGISSNKHRVESLTCLMSLTKKHRRIRKDPSMVI